MVYHHAGVATVRLPHYLVENELRVALDAKPLDPELDSNAQAIHNSLVLRHIVCHAEMKSNHVQELITLEGDQHNTSPNPIKSEGAIKVHAPVLSGNWGSHLLCFGPFHLKVYQCLGLDCPLRDVHYVEPHEL
jgi:hypothetical protein